MNSSPPVAGSLDSGASFSGMTVGSGSIASQASFDGSSMHESSSGSRPGSQMSMGMGLSNGPTSSQSQNGAAGANGSKLNGSGMTSSLSNSTISNDFQGFGVGDIVPPVPPPSHLMHDPTFSPEHPLDFDDDWLPPPRAPPKIPRSENDHLIADWKYEMRREAQQIIPGLYVGPYQSGRLLEPLQTLGITHIVCIFDVREKLFVKPRFPEHFTYLALEVRDAQDQNVIRMFPQVRAFIDDALAHQGKVLVHCGDGISRSPAIVIAYLMMTFNVSHEEAFTHVQNRRFCAAPNTNFQRQIEAYEDIHSASLAMAKYAAGDQSATTLPLNRRKRGDADGDGEEEDEDEELRERNLHAQRMRKGSEEDEVHHYRGEQAMDTS